MNRRGFLAMLAGLPFVAQAMLATEQRVHAAVKTTEPFALAFRDEWEILKEATLRAHENACCRRFLWSEGLTINRA